MHQLKRMKALWWAAGLLVLSCGAQGQQKYKYSYQLPPEIKNTYKQVQTMDVGDVPEHRVRYAELQTVYPAQLPAPMYAGVRVKESNTVLIGEQISGNGTSGGYGVYTLETGDKIFTRVTLTLQSSTSEDGKTATKFDQVSHIIGGTGKFKNIRGVLRSSGRTDMKSATNGNTTEGEYYFQD
jgi:hypothetical protein